MVSRVIWIEQLETASGIEEEFGRGGVLDSIVCQNYLFYFEVAEVTAESRAEIPAIVAEVKAIFGTLAAIRVSGVGRKPGGRNHSNSMPIGAKIPRTSGRNEGRTYEPILGRRT